ncbi:MAG: 1-deoxy-D-xylulose-5-phosphate reductoisomerase [Gammaproteobacteria bacterium]
MIGLTVLGATGSIGASTLDVVARHPDRFKIVALTANRNDELLAEQCARFQPRLAVMADPDSAVRLRQRLSGLSCQTEVLHGAQGLVDAAQLGEADAVMAAIVGAAGLMPSLAAARAGKRVLLANKEALVMSGRLFMDAVREAGALLLPIDSEHNAVFQCMPQLGSFDDAGGGLGGNNGTERAHGHSLRHAGVRRIVLTGSGGPFRDVPFDELHDVSPAQACAHPTWSMGRKISVDSATMMNKGLEVIEACWLFDAPAEKVDVVVHRQSVIHSMVEYEDGSVLAQLGNPDMRTPIAHALAWPDRVESGVAALDLVKVGRLDFEAADLQRFPCLRLGFAAARSGSAASAVLNAANEVAVQSFLDERIRFTHIARLIEEVLEKAELHEPGNLDDVLALDAQGRRLARASILAIAESGF